MTLIFLVGKISDKFGRKPAYILSLLASLISYLTIGYAKSFSQLILTRIPVSLFKHTEASAIAMVCDQYMGDAKTVFIGYIGSSIGLGFILGPFITALFFENSNINPSVISSFIFLVNLVLVIYFLKETKPPRGCTSPKRNPDNVKISKRKYDLLFNSELRIYYYILFGISISTILFNSNYAILLEKVGIDIKELGFMMSYSGFLSVIGGLVIKFIARFSKKKISYIALYLLIVSQFLTPLIASSFQLMLLMIPFIISSKVIKHLFMSLLTSKSPKNNLGEVLSIANSLDSISRTVFPLLGGILVHYINIAAPYYIGSLICLIGLINLYFQNRDIFNFT